MLRVHCAVPETRATTARTSPQSCGGHSEGETPGPIPNPEVKPSSADGTAREASWESRTPPRTIRGPPPVLGGGPLIFVCIDLQEVGDSGRRRQLVAARRCG